jgi:hypothetical protein
MRLDMSGSEWPSKILSMAQNWTFGTSLHWPPQSQGTSAVTGRLSRHVAGLKRLC